MVGEMSNGQASEKPGPILMDDQAYQFLRPGGDYRGDCWSAAPWARITTRRRPRSPHTWDGQNVVTPAQPSKTALDPVDAGGMVDRL